MYKPDPRIIRYLKDYDSDLSAAWDASRERWWVTWRGKPAQLCQDRDGGFIPLDERAVTKVALSDAWQHKSGKEYLKVMAEHNHRLTEAEKAKTRDDFRQYIVEEGHQKVFGVGKFGGWGNGARA